jgi:formylglycine-generating enzyme required for sulfatase activity
MKFSSQGCPYKDIGSQDITRSNLNTLDCIPVSVAGVKPWRFISQSQAISACAKAGKRLPTDEEWYLASLGTPDKGGNWQKDDCQVNNNWSEQPGLTGSGKLCVSAAGAHDMIGNVWEWVKGEIRDGKFNGEELPPAGYITGVDIQGRPIATNDSQADLNFSEDYLWLKATDVRGMARGGYWDNASDAGLYSIYLVYPPSFASPGVGFRCVK